MVEQVIDKLLDVRNGRPGKPVQLTEGQIRQLCLMAKEVFLAQPNLLELEAPIKICGERRCVPISHAGFARPVSLPQTLISQSCR